MTMIDCGKCSTSVSEDDLTRVESPEGEMMVCEDCATLLADELENAPRCVDCADVTLAYGNRIWNGTAIAYRHTYSDGVFIVGESEISFCNGEDYSVGRLCESCRENYTSCDSCGELTADGDANYCDDCDESYCGDWNCEERHESCNYSGNGGTMSISEALARPAVPGNTIRTLRAVGVEIERSSGNVRTAANGLASAGILLESHGEHCGHEYVFLPARGANLESAIRNGFRILADAGATGNDDCGAHFHVDCSTLTRAEILRGVAALRIVESVLFAGTGEEDDARRGIGFRRALNWCQPTASTWDVDVRGVLALSEREFVSSAYSRDAVRDIANAVGQNSRYSAINTHALAEHRTIEVRLMDGVTDPERFLAVIGIALAAFEYGIGATSGTLNALIGQPLSLLYRAAQRGYVSGNASEYLIERYGKVSAEIRMQEQRAAALAEINARRDAVYAATQTARVAARDAYNAATMRATERMQVEISAARDMVTAARRAYDAALQAQYRIEDMARTAFDNSPDVQNAAQIRDAAVREAQEQERATYAALQDEERNVNARFTATPVARPVPSCGVIGCNTCR